jgi:hypothetical protein
MVSKMNSTVNTVWFNKRLVNISSLNIPKFKVISSENLIQQNLNLQI